MRRYMLVSLLGALVIAFFSVTTAEENDRMMTGTIVTLDSVTGTFVASKDVSGGKAEEMRFVMDPAGIVRIHGLKGKLETLKAGDIVTVTYVVKEAKYVATAVQHS